MRANLWTKIVYGALILASCIWLLFTLVIGLRGTIVFFANGSKFAERDPLEILAFLALTLQPVVVLFLIVRAIRLRDFARPWQTIAMAVYPLILAMLLIGDIKLLGYVSYQSEMRRVQSWHTGTITYLCSTTSRTVDYSPQTIGPIELRLTEHRYPRKLGDWIIAWPGKKPIKAVSFQSRTGSIGGSQGIKWRDANGQPMTAYISFSDIISQHGPSGMWVVIVHGNSPIKVMTIKVPGAMNFTCGPDPNSYTE